MRSRTDILPPSFHMGPVMRSRMGSLTLRVHMDHGMCPVWAAYHPVFTWAALIRAAYHPVFTYVDLVTCSRTGSPPSSVHMTSAYRYAFQQDKWSDVVLSQLSLSPLGIAVAFIPFDFDMLSLSMAHIFSSQVQR